jgi:hypothetical protein
MKINKLRDIWKWGLLISIFSFLGCAGPTSLYSVNMYYDADQAAIPAYLKADKASNAIISIAEFTDTRRMDDRLVIGHVVEKDGMKNLVFPKNVKATKAISKGIKEYLRKAGYKVSDKIVQWDLKEETMPKEDFKILIGGNIDELEISCRRGFPTNTCTTNMKLTYYFSGYGQRENIVQKQGGKQLFKGICFVFGRESGRAGRHCSWRCY